MLSRDTIDLGDTDRQATLSLANTGELPLDWSIDGAAAPFAWSARSGTLAPGTTDDLLVSIDRSSLAEGSVNRSFSVSSSGLGTTPLTVLAAVERAPVVRTVTAPSFLRCPGPTGSPVVVAVADESPISGVVLTWSGPGGSGSAPMRPVGDDWEAMLAPAATNGDWTWVAQATDRRGNVGTVGAPFLVSGC